MEPTTTSTKPAVPAVALLPGRLVGAPLRASACLIAPAGFEPAPHGSKGRRPAVRPRGTPLFFLPSCYANSDGLTIISMRENSFRRSS